MNFDSVKTWVSIGIALYPVHGSDSENLIKNVDTAMYESKKQKGNSFSFYEPQKNIKKVGG